MSEPEQKQTIANTHYWYHRRDFRFLILVALVLGLYHGYGYITGPSRISAGLQQAMDQNPEGRFNIVVTAKFPPEEFHMGIYQEYGVMRGTTGKGATLHKVWTHGVKNLSRYYWVTGVDLE
jgi:hypothetical protein